MLSLRLFIKFGFVLFIAGLFTACQGGGEPLQANAGQDFSVPMGQAPVFDGCQSTGDIVNYKWTIVSPPETMPGDAGKVLREVDPNCSFDLAAQMEVEEVGEWVIELEVRDEAGNTSTDTVTVEVTP